MTKYQIISPKGVKVCIVEADDSDIFEDRQRFFIKGKPELNFTLSLDWAAIPIDAIKENDK